MQATEVKHTPGPWACMATSYNYFDYRITKPDGTHFDHTGEERSFQESYANARLIAAAPEMLLALKDAVLFIDEQHEIFREVAKAKGVSAPSLAESPRFMGILETINKAQGGE